MVQANTNALYGLRYIMVSLLFLFHLNCLLGGMGAICVSFFLILSGFDIRYSNCFKAISFDWSNSHIKNRIQK